MLLKYSKPTSDTASPYRCKCQHWHRDRDWLDSEVFEFRLGLEQAQRSEPGGAGMSRCECHWQPKW